MTQPGQHIDKLKGEGSLSERISEAFGARFERLDKLQNAKQVTQEDLDFLEETQALLSEFERNTSGLTEAAARFLEQLRDLFEAANGNADRVDVVAAVEKKTKKKEAQKARVEEPEAEEDDVEEPVEEGDERPTTEMVEADFADDETALAWFDAARHFETLLREVEDEVDPAKRRALLTDAMAAHKEFVDEQFNPAIDGIEDGGDTIDDFPYLILVADRVDAVGNRLTEIAQQEAPAESGESWEDIWNRFNEEIPVLHGEINTLLAKPMGTDEEVRDARETFDLVIANMRGYVDDWKEQVSPILDDLKARNQRWGAWGGLTKEHGALVRRFFGRKAKAEGEENIEGVIQKFGRELRERSRAILQEKWLEEFPGFAVAAAKTIINIQDARMRHGTERVEAMEGIRGTFASLREDWESLRVGGPRISRADREKGERSVVNQYDVMLRELGRDIPALARSASKARPARLDDVAYLWREALVRTEQFWRPGADFKEKIAFLRRYGNGEVEEAEIDEMIRSVERENFEAVAESDVLADLRARSKQKRERREETERRERAQMYHPKLEWIRMDAKDMYRRATNASFWKGEVPLKTRQQFFAADASIDEEELKGLVKDPETDIAACKRYVAMVKTQYDRVKEMEDAMYNDGEQPEEKANGKKLRRIIDRFLEAEEREAEAWKKAKFAEGWRKDPSARGKILHDEFASFWRNGERGFREIPRDLRGPIINWIFARLRLRTLGNYTQWLIDQNPELARSVKNMPRGFDVPEKEVRAEVEEGEESEEGEAEEQISDADRAALVLPEQVIRTGDDAGGGAFDDAQEGAAADNIAREGEEEGDDSEVFGTPAERASEGGAAGREAALDADGRAIVRALTE